MKRCSKCGRQYEDNWVVCFHDGEFLLNIDYENNNPEVEALLLKKGKNKKKEIKTYLLFNSIIFLTLIVVYFSYNEIDLKIFFLKDFNKIYENIMYFLGTIFGLCFVSILIALFFWKIFKIKKLYDDNI